MVADDLAGPCLDRLAVGYVEALGRDLDAGSLAQGHRLGQPRLVDVGQGQVRAPGGEILGQGAADARRRPGDRGDT